MRYLSSIVFFLMCFSTSLVPGRKTISLKVFFCPAVMTTGCDLLFLGKAAALDHFKKHHAQEAKKQKIKYKEIKFFREKYRQEIETRVEKDVFSSYTKVDYDCSVKKAERYRSKKNIIIIK